MFVKKIFNFNDKKNLFNKIIQINKKERKRAIPAYIFNLIKKQNTEKKYSNNINLISLNSYFIINSNVKINLSCYEKIYTSSLTK